MSVSLLARIGSRDRRALMLGAVFAVPVVAHQLMVKPYLAAVGETREAVAQERSLLQRELTLLWHVSHGTQEIRSAQSAASNAYERLFSGGDVIEATSALSGYTARVMRSANVLVQHVESRDAIELPTGLREIALDIRGDASLEAVLLALHGLEAGPRLVRVTRVSVERSVASRAPGSAERLTVIATVRGYARIGE